jgi:hypothetical protein
MVQASMVVEVPLSTDLHPPAYRKQLNQRLRQIPQLLEGISI